MEGPINKKNIISTAVLAALLSCDSSADAGGVTDPFAPVVTSPVPATPPVFAFPTPPPTPPLTPPEYEKCYGVSGKDENDCGYASFDGEPNSCAGTAKACDPGAWRWVPKGTCTRIVVGTREDGTILQGTLQSSMERGEPVLCTPYDPALLKSKPYGL
ncbi:MAG: hypothetical protein A2977_03155 [Alphaproteobacteria bacterium RIFCSPLOWO2_01_FULL_45_8]|nr:MAG: hypothetical protein A3K20_01650 [Alphaproteobacteria bacterium GWA1_45_9]OFW89514.1 MAG: hypothetical protein A2621_01135 [Alphaproteobacteria bacterium RIFCSPHIGHO2_01_FULL_41_14]OFW95853.1 MAG: hypothetical protein A2977_03155 [Alphaproteobacteria bacterium RIFCSPLOWO2_01_FULL_45_8]HCI48732.1 hypothetical protein [Holosporales bacterium]